MTNGRAAEMRRAFDRTFAEAPASGREEVLPFLALRIAGDAYAVRMSEIAGLVPVRRIVPLPNASPELLGLAGHKGSLVPVFDLAALIGRGRAQDNPRWLILCAGDRTAGLAFADVEGQFEAPRSAIHAAGNEPTTRHHVHAMLRVGTRAQGIVDIKSILGTIAKREG